MNNNRVWELLIPARFIPGMEFWCEMQFERFLKLKLFIAFVAIAITHSAGAQEQEKTGTQSCDVPIFGDGSAIVIDVTHNRRNFRFLLDTGCTRTIVDSHTFRTRPDSASGAELGTADDVPQSRERNIPGDFRVAKLLPIQSHDFGHTDLSLLSGVIGERIHGILGCDFMNRYVLEIDVDAGKLRFTDQIQKREGTCVTLRRDEMNRPTVATRFLKNDSKPVEFLIDTGLVGFGGIKLTKNLFKTYVAIGELQVEGEEQVAQLGGREIQRFGKVRQVLLWNKLENVLVREKAGEVQYNLLGLSYLMEYNSTFDFPNSKLYLRPRKTKLDLLRLKDLSGLSVLRDGSDVVVHKVYPQSPAARVGIRDNDTIISVDGVAVEQIRMFPLRKSFCEAGKRVQLGMRRGTKEWTVDLELRDWRKSASEKDFE